MSAREDLDRTIELMNTMLARTKTRRDQLAIIDRLIRAYSLKYKHAEDGRGKMFDVPPERSDAS